MFGKRKTVLCWVPGLAALIAFGIIASPSATAAPATPVSLARPMNAPPPDPTVLDGVKIAYNPFKPSDGPYPKLSPGETLWIDVSIDQQLVYIMSGDRLLYTMATSSGMEWRPTDGSPPGYYHIQAERGRWFYVPRYHEGGEYWVSWLGHGLYLFHSVPMNRNRQVIPSVAARLLHEASHGCFHLTISDAKWFYEHVPTGAPVVVERAAVGFYHRLLLDPTPPQLLAMAQTGSLASASTMLVTPPRE
jgi:lipoprotein-anchoring transpeptidase ErfK/SrfK